MENLLLEKKEGYAIISLHRPKQLNALNLPLILELEQLLDELKEDKSLRCLILTGAGDKAFAAGADIAQMETQTVAMADAFVHDGHRVLRKLETFPTPVVAAVNGYALGGGCEMCLACDIRIAADNAVLGLPETSLGIFPGWGGTQRLPRLIGYDQAALLIFSCNRLKADAAKEVGLVTDVVPQAELMETVEKLAQTIAVRAPLAVQGAKRAMLAGQALPIEDALEEEAKEYAPLFDTKDAKAGLGAFLRKEKAVFMGL